MPLPTVLMTDVIRSAHQGASHGGAYLIDLERGAHRKVLDWNTPDINWEGRGEGRGLRGIAYHGGLVYIAASDEIFVFDPEFNPRGSHRNESLRHCHETFLDGDTLLLTSTAFDSVLWFHVPSATFTRGVCVRFYDDPKAPGGRRLVSHAFDPGKPRAKDNPAPERGDTCHINSVWVRDRTVYACGTSLNRILGIDGPGRGVYAPVPTWTHNARPYQDGVIYNSTAAEHVIIADRAGVERERFHAVTYDRATLTSTDLPQDYARQGFLRGLTTLDDLVIVGSSPSTVSVYQRGKGPEPIRSVNVSRDIRNSPHGLEVWPF